MSPTSSLTPPPGRAPLVYALDYATLADAQRGAAAVAREVGMLKVGLELFCREGPAAVRLGESLGLPVFLDLKLHDIPETVARAVKSAAATGARVLTIHASGGPHMVERAVRAAEDCGGALTVCAVTALTSLTDGDVHALGFARSASELALAWAALAHAAGARCFVCSPREVAALKAACPGATVLTPGIRAATDARSDDQARVETAARAVEAGADWIVVGRPIRDAADPAASARAIGAEALAALAAKVPS